MADEKDLNNQSENNELNNQDQVVQTPNGFVVDDVYEVVTTDVEPEESLEEDEFYGNQSFIGSEADYNKMMAEKALAENRHNDYIKMVEQNNIVRNNHNNFISFRNKEDHLYVKELMRKAKAKRPDFDKETELMKAAREGGFKLQETLMPFTKTIYAKDALGQRAVSYKSGRSTISEEHYFNPAAAKIACLAVKRAGSKEPFIFSDSRMNRDEKLKFYSLMYETLISVGYPPDKIKFDNDAYGKQVRELYLGANASSGVGNFNPENVVKEMTEGQGLNAKKVEKTAAQKELYDDAYELFKAADLVTNKIQAQLGLINNMDKSKKKNMIRDVNDITNNKNLVTDDKVLKSFTVNTHFQNAMKELKTQADLFAAKYKDNPDADKYKDVLRTLAILDKTGYNPLSKNKVDQGLLPSFRLSDLEEMWSHPTRGIEFKRKDKTTGILIDIRDSINGLKNQIQDHNNWEFATLKKNNTKELDRRSADFSRFKTEIESLDVSSASSNTKIMSGAALNKLSNNDSGSNIFPKNAEVYKFNMSGKGVDLYFFDGKNGMQVVAGCGNKLSKARPTTVTKDALIDMMNETLKKKPKLEAPTPEAPKKPVVKPKVVKPDVDSPEPAKAPENAPQAAEPVVAEPLKETFTITSGKKTLDMEFVDGVGRNGGVIYVIKDRVEDLDKVVDDLVKDNPHALAVKVLDAPPVDAQSLLKAETRHETREKPVVVDDIYIIPGVTGYLAYYIGDNKDLSVKEIKKSLPLAAEAAGVSINDINGFFKTNVHSFSLSEIKMNNHEESFVNGYVALTNLQKAESIAARRTANEQEKVEFNEQVKEVPTVEQSGPVKEAQNTDLSSFDDEGLNEFSNKVDEVQAEMSEPEFVDDEPVTRRRKPKVK